MTPRAARPVRYNARVGERRPVDVDNRTGVMLTSGTHARARAPRRRRRRSRATVPLVRALVSPPGAGMSPLFETVARVRDGASTSLRALADAREEAEALATALRIREDQVEALLRDVERADARLAETLARRRDAERRVAAKGPPAPLAEDLWAPPSAPNRVDPWSPEDAAALEADDDRASRARRLIALAQTCSSRSARLVGGGIARAEARDEDEDPFRVRWAPGRRRRRRASDKTPSAARRLGEET